MFTFPLTWDTTPRKVFLALKDKRPLNLAKPDSWSVMLSEKNFDQKCENMKTNKQKPLLKWTQGARTESSHALPLKVNCRPNRKRSNFTSPIGRRLLLYYPAGRRKNISLPGTAQPMRDCHSSASEKPLHFELSISSKGLFVYNSSSQLPLLLY